MGRRHFTKLPCGYCKLESLLAAPAKTSASEVAAAMKADFLRWQGDNGRRDDVTAWVFRL
jgi:hypothetical protein